MKETKNNELDILMERQPFHVPDGYFEGFTGDFMSRLPQRPASNEIKVISLYNRLQPWFYIAASFIGIILLHHIFSKDEVVVSGEDNPLTNATALSAMLMNEKEEDAEFLDFLEELYVDEYALSYIYDDFWDN